MAAFNKSVLVGNLCKDPTTQEVGEKNTPRCSFRLAVNNPRSKDEVLYMNIAVWGKSAESCQKYLQKGSSVLVEGRIRQTKLDNDSYWTEVVAETPVNAAIVSGVTVGVPREVVAETPVSPICC